MSRKLVWFYGMMAASMVASVAFGQAQKPLPPRPLATAASSSSSYTEAPVVSSGGSAKEIVDDSPQAVPSSTAAGRLSVAPGEKTVHDNTYRLTTAPREPKTGWEAGVFGGANLVQDSQDDPEVVGEDAGLGENVDFLAGIKFGYTWAFDGEPIDQFDDVIDSGLRLAGGLEAEAFYLGEKLTFSAPNIPGGDMIVKADVAVFMANFLLKGQFGKWRLHAGPGLGVSYVSIYDNLLDAANGGNGEDDGILFTWQVLGGVSYFINPSWSVFTEYKWINFEDFEFYDSDSQIEAGRFQNHALMMGLKYHF